MVVVGIMVVACAPGADADFTPVCTSEFVTFASMVEQFRQLNCGLIGLSIDSNYGHIVWPRTITERIEFGTGEEAVAVRPASTVAHTDIPDSQPPRSPG